MTLLSGKVLNVETRNLAEPAVAAAAIGDTVLYVNDASIFDENGGLLTVAGAQLAYVSIDADVDSITLAAPLTAVVAEQDPVEVYPPTPVKTALVSLGGDGDPIPATVPHTLLDKFTDGTRSDENAESVVIEQRGTYEFVVSDAVAEPLVQTSLDYVEGEEGYGLTEAGVQLKDMQATGQVGAAVVSADQLLLNGNDLASTLANIPGATSWGSRGDTLSTQWAGNTSSTTELRTFVFNAGDVKAGFAYRISAIGLMSGTVDNDVFWTRLRYTEDGSEPQAGPGFSPVLRSSLCGPILGGRGDIEVTTIYTPATDLNLRLAMTIQRRTGSGTGAIITSAPDTAFQITAQPLGISADATTALQQTAKADGSGSDNVPVITYTKTFDATWSLGWGDYTNVQENSWFWTGVNFDYSTGAYGLIGFDYAAIASFLAGSATPVSAVLKIRPRSRRYSDGLDFRVLTHTNTSLANAHTTWDLYQGDWHGNGSVTDTGIVVNNAAPNVPVNVNLGTTIFNQFKAGTRRGIGIAGVSDTVNGSSGTFYGDGAYQAQLVFTYQG